MPGFVRDLRGVVEREQAQIGVLFSLHEPTQPMRGEPPASAVRAARARWNSVTSA